MPLENVKKRVEELLLDKKDIFQTAKNPEGFLLKAGEAGLFSSAALKNRYFRLDLGILSYYDKKESTKAKGTIPLKQVTGVTLEADWQRKGRPVLKLTTSARVYTLASDDDEILAQWVAKLTNEVSSVNEEEEDEAKNDTDSSAASSASGGGS